MRPPTPGHLRERIRFDAQARLPDALGGQAVTWRAFVALWADVTPPTAGGAEQVESGALAAVYTYRFTIRRRVDLIETMRIVWPVDPNTGANISASRQFNLRSIGLPSTAEAYMVLDAEAGVAL